MNTKKFFTAVITVIVLFVSAISCRTQRTVNLRMANGIDSIKVEVSTKIDRSSVVITSADNAIVYKNNEKKLLDLDMSGKLKSLSNKLFVEKTEKIILAEEPASGRTDHPIFTVTLYRGAVANALRYEMGDEENGVTHCTHKDIRYSKSFREFVLNIFQVIK